MPSAATAPHADNPGIAGGVAQIRAGKIAIDAIDRLPSALVNGCIEFFTVS
ncbi:hypothetical protein D3C83_112480 [compost metagenome]